ncbi:MAG: DoxX family protein, partial [Candidatus Omnitrophica bacterium]|nr:DoxX family protein [Candidatus Omnitrophota bacterium]MBU1851445.1 DoxX family protein [Candidatus Omnitrophota bacterium]
APHSIALIWSCIEFVGGIFLVFGILARYSAVLIISIMLVSIWKINLVYGFFLQNGGFEYNLLIIAACIPLVCIGGGSWSVWDV